MNLPPLGAHMSVAGGVDRAIDRARSAGCTALQIFLKNNNQWAGKPIDEATARRYREEVAKGDLGSPIAHASYLVNLASPGRELLDKSVASVIDEIQRADLLGVPGIVLHPGAHMGEGEAAGIASIARHLNQVFAETGDARASIYLETTAGQGSSIGHRFEHLRDIIAGVECRDRIGICLDTCHVFAAGYDIRREGGLAAMLDEFDEVIGLGLLRALHVNDSKKDLGSRVDRHAHIGQGFIGEAGFAQLMREPRLNHLPHILETPKEENLEEDRTNLATLRRLAGAVC